MIATKGGIRRTRPGEWDHYGHPDYLRSCVDQSLTRLRRDTIDLYYLHRVDRRIPLDDQLGALITARQQGKIRHIGLSKVNLDQLTQAETLTPIAAVQNYRDPANPDHAVRSHCQHSNIAYVPYRPLGGGHALRPELPAREQLHHLFRFQLEDSPNTLLIPGTTSLTHLQGNVAAFASATAAKPTRGRSTPRVTDW